MPIKGKTVSEHAIKRYKNLTILNWFQYIMIAS